MCKTIKQLVKFNASPAIIYDLLADSKKHTAVTGKNAMISRKIGGAFTANGNEVSGVNVDLVPGRRIVQAWRHRKFPEGIFSMAAVTLTPTADGGTKLVLTHRGVPKDLIPETEQAWRDQYWSKIKTYLAQSGQEKETGLASRFTSPSSPQINPYP
ncbi:MAG: SRPBCC domain-containing protein [Spirochaetia bacterium]|nr:SRPBCC domain-containing protein [Spirochaetia bacterium]